MQLNFFMLKKRLISILLCNNSIHYLSSCITTFTGTKNETNFAEKMHFYIVNYVKNQSCGKIISFMSCYSLIFKLFFVCNSKIYHDISSIYKLNCLEYSVENSFKRGFYFQKNIPLFVSSTCVFVLKLFSFSLPPFTFLICDCEKNCKLFTLNTPIYALTFLNKNIFSFFSELTEKRNKRKKFLFCLFIYLFIYSFIKLINSMESQLRNLKHLLDNLRIIKKTPLMDTINDACLVYDGKLVIDASFHTNDVTIRGAGTLTKYQRNRNRKQNTFEKPQTFMNIVIIITMYVCKKIINQIKFKKYQKTKKKQKNKKTQKKNNKKKKTKKRK
ncbi:hypothetical protein KUTeg_014409 [Tegillarca granosa]|uniref:Uncharacterized protein n=1 Tax=Tegillarca granosa TaxID=220873 RepID=A0ABQ9F087_TEGGR|nr:hypothetical protein KUTeg_014409 [Tegillarca granosa]